MASRGKFQRLVDDFVATVDEQGGRIDPAVVAAELQSRIDAIARQLGITRQTVLRSYFDEDWGRQVAITMMAEVRSRDRARRAWRAAARPRCRATAGRARAGDPVRHDQR